MRQLEDGTVIGAVGSQEDGIRFMDWFEAGSNPDTYPALTMEDIPTQLIVISREGAYTLNRTPTPLIVHEGFMAWGSGMDFALGALAAGMDALKAVEITCLFDASCGNGYDLYTL